MKQKLIITLSVIIISCILIAFTFTSCSNPKTDNADIENTSIPEKLPLNISVYLDLSDRLTRELTPSQADRDTAIVNHLVDIFIDDCIKDKIINSSNHFQIFFYPSPNNSQIAQLARGLNLDMSKCDIKNKKKELMEMKQRFQNNLSQIYSDALEEQKFVGSDIWGFFSNKEVDKLCIRKGYRNILVILTDGYLYHTDNKVQDGNAYSYILPQTLAIDNSSLIVKRNNLSNLEVLMLEVNPYSPAQHDKLMSVLEDWFKNMGVEKFIVSETALPVNTEVYIDSFIND